MTISLPMYRALCYADVFAFPLTLEEMRRYAIRVGGKIPKEELEKRVKKSRGYYYLQGRSSIVAKRIASLPMVHKKQHMARRAAGFFGLFPTIQAVFLTGGLAVGNAAEQDDLDFMIVTKPGWLWTSRFFVVGMSKLLGRYTHKRLSRKDATLADANTWCLNFWLDETSLAVPKKFQNLYTAREVLQATPLLDHDGVAKHFLAVNAWIFSYLEGKKRKMTSVTHKGVVRKTPPSLIERFFFWVQRGAIGHRSDYVRNAHFFPKDTGGVVLRRFHELVR